MAGHVADHVLERITRAYQDFRTAAATAGVKRALAKQVSDPNGAAGGEAFPRAAEVVERQIKLLMTLPSNSGTETTLALPATCSAEDSETEPCGGGRIASTWT